jgi:hypothetical protein
MPIAPDTLSALYDERLPDLDVPASGRIHPYVGDAYTTERPAFRVMAIGINAYCDDGSISQPGWFPAMFAKQSYHFQKRVVTEVGIVARALVTLPRYAGRPFLGIPSILHTNAVKRWVPRSKGRYAHRVDEGLLDKAAARQ